MPPRATTRSYSGYEALPALDDHDHANDEHDQLLHNDIHNDSATALARSQHRRPHQRTRSGTLSIANLNELDVKFKEWTQTVARRFAKGKGG